MASLVIYLSATVLFAQSTVAFNCSQPPVYVDIHKRAVHGTDVFQYGAFIGVGSPAQNQSIWPSLAHNQTSFASSNYCNNATTLSDCSVSTSGFFDPTQSTSFISDEGFQALDNDTGAFKGDFGQDTLHLYTHYFETDPAFQTLVSNSTIEVAQSGSIRPGIAGFGLSSTLLEDLANRGMTAGRTYSLYIGQGFDRAGGVVNGSNVFGGYDRGRFTGAVHQYPMRPNIGQSPLRVHVKDIIISDGGNSSKNVSLFSTSAFPNMKTAPGPFDAEITTDQYPLSLPYDITQNFISHMAAQQDNSWGDNSLKLQNPTTSTLSIVLDDGFTVTLPPEVLANVSNITPVQNRDKDSTAPFYLSAAFLGQVYLMLDYESWNFYMATAIQKNAPVMPVTFCPKSVPVPYSPPNQSSFVRRGLVGAVIGGVLGGIGIAVMSYCCVLGARRKIAEKRMEREVEKGRRAKMAQMEIEEAPEFDPPPKSATPFLWKR